MGVGPSTKETTLHHFRDPLLNIVGEDKDINLIGIVIVGTPQDNKEKLFLGDRVGTLVEAMGAEGTIVSVDGWGNSHVDFAHTIEEIGKKNIPVVGMSFVGTQGKFVVTNSYMDTIVDFNKSKLGIETEVVGENNVTALDAKKAIGFLKLKMRNRGNKI